MEEPDTPDHYFLLEIDQTATEREVTKSYRKMSLKWHPDKNPGRQKEAQSNMVKLNLAYEVLRDAVSRAKYDKIYVHIAGKWHQFREYTRHAAEERRKREERERERQEEMQRQQAAQEARRRTEEERAKKRQSSAGRAKKNQREADLKSAEAAAKYRQQQADAANERLRKMQEEEREREERRSEERKKNKQREADLRSAEAAAKYQQEQAAAAEERLRKLKAQEAVRKQEAAELRSAAAAAKYQKEQAAMAEERLRKLKTQEAEREKKNRDEPRKSRQREADLRSAAAAAAKYRQELATLANQRLRELQQQEREFAKDSVLELQDKIWEAERILAEAAARCQQEQGEDNADSGVEMGDCDEEKERQTVLLRALYEEQQRRFRQSSVSSQWPHKQRVHWIRTKYNNSIQLWADQSRQVGGTPNLGRKKYQLLLKACGQWLGWLETLAISEELRKDADLDELLGTVHLKEGVHFPVPLRARARLLYSKWEMIGWGL